MGKIRGTSLQEEHEANVGIGMRVAILTRVTLPRRRMVGMNLKVRLHASGA
jgi:hypothetical protein